MKLVVKESTLLIAQKKCYFNWRRVAAVAPTVVFALLLSAIFMTPAVFADATKNLNYQGRLVDANGVPLADGSYTVLFELYDAETGGSLVWDQSLSATVADGLFSAVLGSAADPLSVVNWNQDLWLQVTVSGTTYTPRQRVSGVAFAMTVPYNSLTAAHLAVDVVSSVDGVTNDGGNIDLVAGSGIIIAPDDAANTITIAVSGATIDHGSLTGLGDDDHPQYFALAQNESVTGVPSFDGGTSGTTPPFSVDSTFLVSNLNADLLDGKHYADATSDFVNVTGDTMTGALAMSGANGDITFDNLGGNLTLAGGTITDSAGDIKFSDSATITGVLTSTVANGTAPMAITSSTKVANLNSDKLDGIEGQYLWKTIYDADVTLTTTETQVDLSSYPNSIYKIYFLGKYAGSSCGDNWIQMKFNGSAPAKEGQRDIHL